MYAGNVLQGDSINSIAKRTFIIKNDVSDGYRENPNTTGQYITIERNTGAALFISGETIKQDGKTIGSYKESSEVIEGNPKTIISFYLPGQIKAAKLTADNFNSATNTLLTFKDNKLATVTELSGDMFADKNTNIEKVVKWLIERGYL